MHPCLLRCLFSFLKTGLFTSLPLKKVPSEGNIGVLVVPWTMRPLFYPTPIDATPTAGHQARKAWASPPQKLRFQGPLLTNILDHNWAAVLNFCSTKLEELTSRLNFTPQCLGPPFHPLTKILDQHITPQHSNECSAFSSDKLLQHKTGTADWLSPGCKKWLLFLQRVKGYYSTTLWSNWLLFLQGVKGYYSSTLRSIAD